MALYSIFVNKFKHINDNQYKYKYQYNQYKFEYVDFNLDLNKYDNDWIIYGRYTF